jgi:rhodanese-related sulfurtransferase
MSVEDVKKHIDAGEKITIIDTRSKFTGAMVKGAQLVSMDKIPEWSKDLPKNTFILAYCT